MVEARRRKRNAIVGDESKRNGMYINATARLLDFCDEILPSKNENGNE
jgi:hypothetical protein